jgi:hypothetical protein
MITDIFQLVIVAGLGVGTLYLFTKILDVRIKN